MNDDDLFDLDEGVTHSRGAKGLVDFFRMKLYPFKRTLCTIVPIEKDMEVL